MPNKELKERPIIFSAPMVRVILDGRKTQTRRVVKPQPYWENPEPCCSETAEGWQGPINYGTWADCGDAEMGFRRCPYGQRGDRLWLREKYTLTNHGDPVYLADFKDKRGDYWHSIAVDPKDVKWKSPIFMPRAFSRITLEITDIRVERLQDIRQDGAKAEGATPKLPRILGDDYIFRDDYTGGFIDLWKSINGAGSWDANPWVWVIGFERVTP